MDLIHNEILVLISCDSLTFITIILSRQHTMQSLNVAYAACIENLMYC